jgi:hypothetical protein
MPQWAQLGGRLRIDIFSNHLWKRKGEKPCSVSPENHMGEKGGKREEDDPRERRSRTTRQAWVAWRLGLQSREMGFSAQQHQELFFATISNNQRRLMERKA